ncbi:MAG: 3-keto-disaccharide hydrolase [Rubripirellula sp.]
MNCSVGGRFLIAAILAFVSLSGCRKPVSETDASPADAPPASEGAKESASVPVQPQAFEVGAEELLAARLPESEASEGWIRLFDGHTLFGWEIAGQANWRVEDQTIVVDDGDACLLCTSVPWKNYELVLEFNADEGTNSGVFLRTPLDPLDPALDCYEVNIAPVDNPFPTGGVVKRKKASEIQESPGTWQTMRMVLDGRDLKVSVDGKELCSFEDPLDLPAGRIGLQHNSGKIAFRNIRLRPLGLETLLDADLTQWTKYPEMPGEFSVTDEGWLHVQGGRTQLESKQSYGDFVLLAEYKMPDAAMNSGIFFRCIPGDEMMGYECQLSNEMKDGNPLAPADCGTGGIFRRQDARIVAGEAEQWATVLLVADGPKIASWVNGVQVSDWWDDREPHENPRKGLRVEPGTFMIHGHDPGTDAYLKQIQVASAMTSQPRDSEPDTDDKGTSTDSDGPVTETSDTSASEQSSDSDTKSGE